MSRGSRLRQLELSDPGAVDRGQEVESSARVSPRGSRSIPGVRARPRTPKGCGPEGRLRTEGDRSHLLDNRDGRAVEDSPVRRHHNGLDTCLSLPPRLNHGDCSPVSIKDDRPTVGPATNRPAVLEEVTAPEVLELDRLAAVEGRVTSRRSRASGASTLQTSPRMEVSPP